MLAGDGRDVVRADDVPRLQQGQARIDRAAVLHEVRHGAGPEDGTRHRCVLGQPLLLAREPVEPGTDQALQARRHGHVLELLPHADVRQDARLDQHPDGLLQEERVAARPREQGVDGALRREVVLGKERTQERLSVNRGQRLEGDTHVVRRLDEPLRPGVVQLGPAGAEDEDRTAGSVLNEVGDQLEQRRLGPVQVFEDDHERTLHGVQLEEAPDAPVQLGL